jgi:hypothetical protein
VIRTVARDDESVGDAARLARELDRMLVGVGAAEREVDAPAFEPARVEQGPRQLGARPRTPCAGDEAQTLGLVADRAHYGPMLVTEVAALGQAAHVEVIAAIGVEKMRAAAADDRRCVPLRLHAPAVQDVGALVRHRRHFRNRSTPPPCLPLDARLHDPAQPRPTRSTNASTFVRLSNRNSYCEHIAESLGCAVKAACAIARGPDAAPAQSRATIQRRCEKTQCVEVRGAEKIAIRNIA